MKDGSRAASGVVEGAKNDVVTRVVTSGDSSRDGVC